MADTVRAVCPSCQNSLRIPAAWADKSVKCKKCGAVIQGKKSTGVSATIPTAARAKSAEPAPAPMLAPAPVPEPTAPTPVAAAPVPAPYPTAPADPNLPPGYPPGYAPPPGYGYPAPPPGYQYPGYGYAPPPGYPAPQPGYGYALPPGYPPQPGYGYAPPGYPDPNAAAYQPAPPGYPPQPGGMPPHGVPPAAPVDTGFVPEPGVTAGRRKKKSGSGKYVAAAIALLVVGGLGVGGVMFKDKITTALNGGKPATTEKSAAPGIKSTVNTGFPRRMLVMSVSKYLYCNGLSNGPFDPAVDGPRAKKHGDRVTEVAGRLAFDWRIPTDKNNNQLYVLTDTTAADPRPMLKPVIQQTVNQFLDTSRAADHVVIYFGGHAVEKDGKAYLVPVEGELEVPETLIPVDEFYAKLKACPAHQKVLMLDVCRINESDDEVRPGSSAMTPELEKALLAVPAGVQVVLGCSAGQRGLEFRNTPVSRTDPKDPSRNVLADVYGSLFLSALNYAGSSGKAKEPKDAPATDPIPVEKWVDAAMDRMTQVATLVGKPDPVLTAGGTPPTGTVELAADAPTVKRFEVPAAPVGMPRKEVERLLTPVALPSIRPSQAASEEPIENVVPFEPAVMKPYLVAAAMPAEEFDAEKFPIRKATADALKLIRTEWGNATGTPGESKLRDRFEGETDDGVKKVIRGEQEAPARIILELEEAMMMMEMVKEKLAEEESKFWQVTYLYALAEVKARLAFMHEYDLALAGILTEALPELDKTKGQNGYQMVSAGKMKSKRDVREIADGAKELFAQIAEEHKGTPWAVYAKRTQTVSLGLEWRPYTPPSMVRDE